MVDFIQHWSYLPNLLEDLKALSRRRKSSDFVGRRIQRSRSASTDILSVRNSVCVAGNDRDSVLSVKRLVYRLLSGRCALESFHFRNEDDIKDGALFVPKVILVATFQPGRKLIDDEEDEGQLDLAYDEIYRIGAELMLVYVDLPKLVYPMNTQNLYHVRLEQLVFPEQKIVKNLACHGLLLTLTENSLKFNQSQEQRMLEWLLKPVNPKTHPVFKTCAMINSMEKQKRLEELRQNRASAAGALDFNDGHSSQNGEESNRYYFANFSGSNEEENSSNLPARNSLLGPKIHIRQTTSLSDSSDNDLDEIQMTHHGFMKSMESYPLLKRNSRSRRKMTGCNSNKKCRGPERNSTQSAKSIFCYGSTSRNDEASKARVSQN